MFYSKEVDGGNFKCQVQSLPPPKSPMKTYVLLARSLAASPNTPTLIPEHCGYRGDLTGGRGWGCQLGNSSLRPLADILSIARGHQDLQAEGRGRRMSRGQRARLRPHRSANHQRGKAPQGTLAYPQRSAGAAGQWHTGNCDWDGAWATHIPARRYRPPLLGGPHGGRCPSPSALQRVSSAPWRRACGWGWSIRAPDPPAQSHGIHEGRATPQDSYRLQSCPPHPRPTCPHLHIGVLLRRQVEDPAGIVVQPLQQVIQTQPALTDCCQQQWQHGFQPWEARGRPGPTLLLQGVRGWERREQYPQAQSSPRLGSHTGHWDWDCTDLLAPMLTSSAYKENR